MDILHLKEKKQTGFSETLQNLRFSKVGNTNSSPLSVSSTFVDDRRWICD